MKDFSNTSTLVYHNPDSTSTPVRYAIIDSQPWFLGKDITTLCGYKDSWRAIDYHVSPENKDHTLYNSHKYTIVNLEGFKQLATDPKYINTFVNHYKQDSTQNLPTVFNHPQFGNLRTVEINGEPYFVGKDVADALGYTNPTKAIRDHVDDDDKKMGVQNVTPSITDNLGRVQYPTWINESGLYSLILSSKLPSAKEFKHWVTSEVLPSIRKTGGYVNSSQSDLFLDTYLPFADQNTRLLFKTTLDTIQQQNTTIQQQNQTISHQEDIIRNLTSDIPLADRRQILNRIVRFGGSPHTRWPYLYREFDNKFHMNTKVQLDRYNLTHRPKLKNRLDYIEHIGMFDQLAEIASVIFGPDIEKLSTQFYEICS